MTENGPRPAGLLDRTLPPRGAVDKALALGVLASELAGATDRFSFSRFALSDGFS
jgi:hypothetical protein